jgi:hypothetical protein
MKRAFPIFRLLFLLICSLCSIISCSSSTGIDDFYTINLGKAGSFSVSPQVILHQDVSVPFQIIIDSADLITSPTLQTSFANIKSAELTKLTFSSIASFPMTNFDTLRLIASNDSLTDLTLATYIGAQDSVYLTHADFGAYLKKPSSHYSIIYNAIKAPTQAVNISASYTVTLTAAPLQ